MFDRNVILQSLKYASCAYVQHTTGATIVNQKYDGESNYFTTMDVHKLHIWEVTAEPTTGEVHPLHVCDRSTINWDVTNPQSIRGMCLCDRSTSIIFRHVLF